MHSFLWENNALFLRIFCRQVYSSKMAFHFCDGCTGALAPWAVICLSGARSLAYWKVPATSVLYFTPASLQRFIAVILFESEQEIWCALNAPEHIPSPVVAKMLRDCCVLPLSTAARFSLILSEIEAAMMVFALPCCFKSIQLRFLGLYRPTGSLHNQISVWSRGHVGFSLFSLIFRFVCTVYLRPARRGHTKRLCLFRL